MKTLITKSLAAAFAFGTLFTLAPSASAETIYVNGGSYSHCDHYVECYRGDRCYNNNVAVRYQGSGCYNESACYHQPSCYHEQTCYRPSNCYVTQSSCQISRCR